MPDRTHDPREDDAKRLLHQLNRRKEDVDGWRRFWAGLRESDKAILREIVGKS